MSLDVTVQPSPVPCGTERAQALAASTAALEEHAIAELKVVTPRARRASTGQTDRCLLRRALTFVDELAPEPGRDLMATGHAVLSQARRR